MAKAVSYGSIDRSSKALGRDQTVAVADKFRNLVPVNLWKIEIEAHPSARANVGRDEEPFGVGNDKFLVLVWWHFAVESHSSVAVVVVQIVGERFPPHTKGDVLLLLDGDLGKRATDVDNLPATIAIG